MGSQCLIYCSLKVRDLGALLIHIGKRSEGLELLSSYQSWIQGGKLLEKANVSDTEPIIASSASGSGSRSDAPGAYGSRSDAPGAYASLVANVLLVQRRKALESAFSGDGLSPGTTEFMAQDLE